MPLYGSRCPWTVSRSERDDRSLWRQKTAESPYVTRLGSGGVLNLEPAGRICQWMWLECMVWPVAPTGTQEQNKSALFCSLFHQRRTNKPVLSADVNYWGLCNQLRQKKEKQIWADAFGHRHHGMSAQRVSADRNFSKEVKLSFPVRPVTSAVALWLRD